MTNEEQKDKFLALLAWWREAGVADALDDEPVDWTARPDVAPGAGFAWPEPIETPSVETGGRPAAPSRPASGRPPEARPGPPAEVSRPFPRNDQRPPAPVPSHRPPATPIDEPGARLPARREPTALASAREMARSARSLEELEALLQRFEGCPLKATAKTTCVSRGATKARLMVIGEAPGRDEDLAGKPFVGRAGQLLDRMLAAIELTEADVHITNIVYWRPPGNRTPTPEEAQACRPFLERQIDLVAPEIILTLGGPAAKAMLDTPDGILKLRGRWREVQIGGRTIRLLPTLHPAYLLRQPEAKRQAWRDLLQLKAALDGQTEGKAP
jgi:uracil-DNA glycosylase